MVSIGSRQWILYLIYLTILYLSLKGKEAIWILILGLTVLWKTLRNRKLASLLEEEWRAFRKGPTAEVHVKSRQLSQMNILEALLTPKDFRRWSRHVSGPHPHPSPSSAHPPSKLPWCWLNTCSKAKFLSLMIVTELGKLPTGKREA